MRKSLLFAMLAAGFSGPAAAQTFGPPIPGLCLLSRAAAIANSRAGRSMQGQLDRLRTELTGQIAQQRTALEQQRRSLEARQASIAPIEYQRQQGALAQQAQMMERIEQERNNRFIAAQTRGQQQIDRALGTSLAQVVTRVGCSVVIERDTAYGWNNAMDITPAVTQGMDAALQSVTL